MNSLPLASPAPGLSTLSKSASGSASNNTINTNINNTRANEDTTNGSSRSMPSTTTKPAPVKVAQNPKYSTIAIKPKPVPIAVLPKTSRPPSYKSTFDLNSRSSLKSDISLNINTSKKWVLPPRPRPGRKPTTSQKCSPPPELKATSPKVPKKRSKLVKKEPASSDKKSVVMSPSVSSPDTKPSPVVKIESEDIFMKKSATVDSIMKVDTLPVTNKKPGIADSVPIAMKKPSPTPIKIEPDLMIPGANRVQTNVKPLITLKQQPIKPLKPNKEDLIYLQNIYLSKLKEQELIRNYIEVINNQIKELNFVQSGVISLDALNGEHPATAGESTVQNEAKSTKSILPSAHEQLENINNMNDLNKFLSYLTKSSNIIYSVTKKFMNQKNEDEAKVLEEQINHYLEKRSKYKTLKNQEVRTIEKLKKERQKQELLKQKSPPSPKTETTPKLELTPSSILISSVNSPNSPPGISDSTPSAFIPSLLRPLKSFQDIDDLNDMQFLNGSDGDFLNQSYLDDNFEEGEATNTQGLHYRDFYDNEMFTNLKPEPKVAPVPQPQSKIEPKVETKVETKGKKKFNCGFCTNDTPCLCLDADEF